MVLSLSVSNLFFCMTASDSHGFAHGDAPYNIEILRHELETLNQLVVVLVERELLVVQVLIQKQGYYE